METILRHQLADYLNVGTAESEKYALMGAGFNALDENPNAQQETKIYISDRSSSTVVKSYQAQFPFDTDLVKDEEAVMALYSVGRNQKTGGDCIYDYVRVELFEPVEASQNTFKARKFKVAVEVSGLAGAGGEAIKVTGNLNAVGNFTEGTFNTETKTFTSIKA